MAKIAKPTVKVTVEGDELVIRLPYDPKGKLSGSGKSKVLASTNGNVKTEIMVDDKPLTVGVNAYVPA